MNTVNNLSAVQTIANALSDLNKKVVFVGGAVVSLYSNDAAAGDVRETDDVDITLEIASLAELEMIRELMTNKGFIQSAEDAEICRFHYKGIGVDVMGTEEMGWAPGNSWFKSGFSDVQEIKVYETSINILPMAYFLATKFSAYHDRGGNDPRASHDFEDITYILDNRTDLVEQILNSPGDVRSFLRSEFEEIVDSKLLQEAVLGNLSYLLQTERFNIIMEKLKEAISGS